MNKQDARGEMRPAGIGLLVFTALVFVALFWILRPADHPLALQRDVPLCTLLPPEAWTALSPAGEPVVVRSAPQNPSLCELSGEPAPGAAQGASPPFARVMLTTEADLRYRNLGNSLGQYINTFVSEMKASDWKPQEVQGPWRRTYGFTNSAGESALLIEDDGVFLLISSPEYPVSGLHDFALDVTARLREAEPGH